jgi:hypothetical protein
MFVGANISFLKTHLLATIAFLHYMTTCNQKKKGYTNHLLLTYPYSYYNVCNLSPVKQAVLQ